MQNAGRPVNPSCEWTANEWHTIRVIFKISSTILCVDDKIIEIGTPYSLEKCIGEGGVLWFGHASWGNGEGFNGFIDYIKIWNGAVYDGLYNGLKYEQIDEEKFLVTERVTDPKYTTVNMFDYWITGQSDNDYATLEKSSDGTHDALLQGINKNHLFLFAGETAFSGGPLAQATAGEIGSWNRSTGSLGANGELVTTNAITQGIVKNTLEGGYPVLALNDDGRWTAPSNTELQKLWNNNKRTESLAYLFDPDYNVDDGKVSYPNVTGLFRLNDEGYYEFRSWNTFAELNADQKTGSKTSTDENHITLYSEIWGWGLPAEHDGQFFPFNDWSDMFFVDPSTGKLEQAHKNDIGKGTDGSGQTTTDEPLNHYFGMTVETEFQQPVDGKLDRGGKNEAMKFEFSGDDDIWIFIDNVLVGDLGGIHGWKGISIDFSTGEIFIDYSIVNRESGFPINEYESAAYKTDLKTMFKNAGKDSTVGWNGNTFSDNSLHTLKFFYLERGNQFSNCNITFNLQEPIKDHIRKVDENGDPLAGVTFELYEADVNGNFNNSKRWHTSDEFTAGTLMTTTTSNESGYAPLTGENGAALSYKTDKYYILEETETQAGYRKNPPIVLKYHSETRTLTVVNKYETGAYASFLADWAQTTEPTNANELRDGLAVMVPVVNKGGEWQPMYGSNTLGWNIIEPDNDYMKALAVAVIMQIADSNPKTQHWYLRWDESESRLKGHIENLPGDATRYGAGGDIELVTLLLPEAALKTLGLNDVYENDDERYAALRTELEGTALNSAEELAAKLSSLEIINTDAFDKNNRTVIYVPNEQRELRVRKVDENGDPLKGAVFALLDSNNVEKARGKTDDNGMLIFRAKPLTDSETEAGYAKMEWDSGGTKTNTGAVYWLKEITAPTGYELNENLIRIEVGNAGIYANATGFDPEGKILEGDAAENDGIKVEASLGRLPQTLVKYAEGNVDETLKYITVTKQTAKSADGALNINSWRDADGDAAESKDLTYIANGYDSAAFSAENDYIRVMPRQTEGKDHIAKCDDLTDVDLNGLFSLINTVVVTDTLPGTGSLTVSKTVTGKGADFGKEFNFTVKLNDNTINGIYGEMTFTDGVAIFTLKNDESKTAENLPTGTKYTVKEDSYGGYDAAYTDKTGTQITAESDLSIMKDVESKVNVTNTYAPETGNLTVSKTVTGEGADTAKEFKFTVTLSDNTINGTYGEMTFTDGAAVFTLKHGESVTFTGLPAGVTYTVTEAETDGYELDSSAGAVGEIIASGNSEAKFINKINKIDGSGNQSESGESENSTDKPGDASGSGNSNKPAENISSGTAVYAANEEIGTVIASSLVVILVISAIAAFVFILKKKKI